MDIMDIIETSWFPFLILYNIIFILFLVNYMFIFNSQLMKKILVVHGFVDEDDEDYNSYETKHFHNIDTITGNYNITSPINSNDFVWIGHDYLLVPYDKITTIRKRFRKTEIWFAGYESKGKTYKIKKLEKGWIKRKVSKQIVKFYNGTFIIGNLMIKSNNLTSLRINSKNKQNFTLTYTFDNGSTRTVTMSFAEFKTIVGPKIPYNMAFLSHCELIELR